MKEQFLREVSEFVKTHIIGREREFDDLNAAIPNSVYKAFQDAGLANWWVSERYGGRGLSLEDSVDIVEELAYGDAGTAFAFYISVLCTSVIELYGNEEQKQQFLQPLLANHGFTSMLGSEQEAGSELLRIKTTAVSQGDSGDSFVINGEKYFGTNAEFADFLIIVTSCLEDPTGFKAFMVPKGTPGVEIVRRWPVMGVRGSGTYQVSLKNVIVPAANGLEPNGLRILEIGLNFSRVLIAATAVGVGRRIRDLCVNYAQSKKIKDVPLLHNPVFMAKIGQMEADLHCMRSVCQTAARELDQLFRSPDGGAQLLRLGTVKSAMIAKLFCGQTGWRLAGIGSEMFGGSGYSSDVLMEKLMRDIRYVSIVEGGEDVCRELIYSRFVRVKSA